MDPKNLKTMLSLYSDDDFNLFIPKTMLKLSDSEIKTIQFAFWFCHAVESDLDSVLRLAFKQMEMVEGKTPEEIVEFVKNKYKIRFEIVDPTNPKHDPNNISFNDRIDIVEKMDGTSDHTKFLRDIKDIRNNLSHGRIKDLTYKGQSLFLKETKEKLVFDHIEQMINTKNNKSVGGVANQLTQEEQKRVNEKYQNWLNGNAQKNQNLKK